MPPLRSHKALPDDIIVVSGVVTETVTVNKTITIRGPLPDEATPGTQMGIVQAAASAPVGNGSRGSVFTIQSGISVTIGGAEHPVRRRSPRGRDQQLRRLAVWRV